MVDEQDYHIEIHRRSKQVRISEKAIRKAVRAALARRKTRCASVSVAVVDDEEIARLNESYLGHTGATDVLSFDLRDDAEGNEVDGEVVVSAETARRQAALCGVGIRGELILYVIHGTLHLLGCDDAKPEDAAGMHETEDNLLESLGYGAVYRRGSRQ
jgi:probable rRNA maturation factor